MDNKLAKAVLITSGAILFMSSVILWRIGSMPARAIQLSGQRIGETIKDRPIVTERWIMEDGGLESMEHWRRRHQEAVLVAMEPR